MATNFNRGGSLYGVAAPYRSQEGLSTRSVGGSDEVQLRIDPMHGELDDEITGLRKQVRRLRNVAREIETEASFQNDLLNQLARRPVQATGRTRTDIKQMTMIKAQAGVKNNVRRLNKSIVKYGSNNVIHVVVFALVCLFFVYLCAKVSRR